MELIWFVGNKFGPLGTNLEAWNKFDGFEFHGLGGREPELDVPPEISAWPGLTRSQRDFSLAKLDEFAEISALASVASTRK